MDPELVAVAQALKAKLEDLLTSENHKLFLGQMDPEKAAQRKKAADDFNARNDKK